MHRTTTHCRHFSICVGPGKGRRGALAELQASCGAQSTTASFPNAELLAKLAKAAEPSKGDFRAQEPSMGVEVLAKAAEPCSGIGDFNAQGLPNTAWAFAKAG